MNKKHGFIAGMLVAATALNAIAQDNGVISIIGGNPNNRGNTTGTVLGTPGVYEVQTYDRNQLERLTVEHFSANQKEDKDFVVMMAGEIEAELNKLAQLNVSEEGFFKLYNKSLSGAVDVVTYVTAQQTLQTQLNLIQNRINSLLLIPSSLQSKEEVQVRGQVVTTLPKKLQVDLEQMKSFYTKQMNAMIGQIQGLNINVRMADGVIEQAVGPGWTPPANRLDYKFLENERKMALRDASIDISQTEMVNDLNRHNLAMIRSVIKAFGTTQRYRFQLNKEGRDRNLETLAEAFWARNYLRSVFGVKLGVISVDYTKQMINWDFFASSNKLAFLGEFVTSDSDLIEYQDKLANALVTQEARDKEVFGEGVDLLSRIMSGVTFIKGESQLASINVVVLQLLKYDIEMDQMLGKPGGLRDVRASYRSTYYKTEASEAFIRERAKAYANMINMDSDGAEDDMMIIGQGSDLKGEFMKSVQALETVVDKVDQAKRRLVAIEALRGSNKTRDNVRKRTDDL